MRVLAYYLTSFPHGGSSVPLTPMITEVAIDVWQICPWRAMMTHPPLQAVNSSPGAGRHPGNKEDTMPTGPSPWAKSYLLNSIPNKTIWSSHVTLWYAPSKCPSGFTPRRRRGEGRADTRERIIWLHSGRWQHEDETACYVVTDFFKPYIHFENLYFYL